MSYFCFWVCFSKGVCERGQGGPHLLQVVELHGDLSEEEVNVGPPLHGADEERLWNGGEQR